jgi:hypothetical protein
MDIAEGGQPFVQLGTGTILKTGGNLVRQKKECHLNLLVRFGLQRECEEEKMMNSGLEHFEDATIPVREYG